MSGFQQNLPLQIIPKNDNPDGRKFQGILEEMEASRMRIKIDKDFLLKDRGKEIIVEFTNLNYNFQFESEVLPELEKEIIFVQKPKVIHKSMIRKTQRLKTYIKFYFTIWTENGRFEGVITDLSIVGIKMISQKSLAKNLILSVSVFLPGTSLRFICQGLVMWSEPDANQTNTFLSGVKFTTLSIDSIKKVERYIQDNNKDKPRS